MHVLCYKNAVEQCNCIFKAIVMLIKTHPYEIQINQAMKR